MGVLSYRYEDLRDALDAIVRMNATEEAYEVASQFGWYELFPGAIYRKENWMEVKTAREILTRAKKDDIFDGDIPEGDSDAIARAEEIVELAEQAWSSHVRGPEVEAILNLAKADQNGGDPEADSSDEPDAETDDSGDDIPEGTPSVFADLPAKLSKSEPWEGYGEATVKEVTEGINWFGENNEDEVLDILTNVWAYEEAHKNRARVLEFVKEAYVKFGGELGSEAEADDSAEVSEEIEAPEDGEEAGDSESVESEGDDGVSEEDGTEDADSDDDSDADADAGAEEGAESSEGKSGKGKSTPKDSGKGSGGGEGSPSAEAKLVNLVEAELKRERLDGIPSKPKHDAPELPWKWADISDADLHDLHMQYASLAFYKSYQRARDERIAMHCKEAADEIRNKLLIEAPKYDEKNKPITVTVIEAQINSNASVRRWRKMQAKYERFAVQAKHELESLHKVVEALSRLETMRHNAFERSGK